MRAVLLDFALFSAKSGFRPTFPVTASVVERHPNLFRLMQSLDVELAVHGFRHIDYTQIPEKTAQEHFKKTRHIFNRAGLSYTGFRYPFLRRSADRIRLLAEYDFVWDSSDVITWHFEPPSSVKPEAWQNYLRILESYRPENEETAISLPRRDHGLIEIPVSVPDDDILIERLGCSKMEIAHIWKDIFIRTHRRGECFVIQLHPERFPYFKGALQSLLGFAKREGTVWIASLGEIASWWKRKTGFHVRLERDGRTGWTIRTEATNEAALLGLNIPEMSDTCALWKNWRILPPACRIPGKKKPIIGLSPRVPESLKIFLADEGFIFEITDEPDNYSIYLTDYYSVENISRRRVLDYIEESEYPVIRFWRWPAPFVSCLAITGDIDGVDLWDYWSRFYGS